MFYEVKDETKMLKRWNYYEMTAPKKSSDKNHFLTTSMNAPLRDFEHELFIYDID